MLFETIDLKQVFPKLPKTDTDVVLTSYARTQTDGAFSEKRPAVIVLHGGGYYMKSITEYTPVALRFMAEGYQAFTLDYSLLPTQYPQQLLELAAAISYLRNNAKKYSIDCNRIILCGFSAGAHLASMLANKWTQAELFSPLSLSPQSIRPNRVILSYPPTTPQLTDCRQMFSNLSNGSDDTDILEEISPIHTINANTPPIFLWQTVSDEMVSVQHSILLAQALAQAKISFEFHLFPSGPHAMSLCDKECAFTAEHLNPHAAQWFTLALKWLEDFK